MNRIDKKFRELKKQNKKAFIVFITAGYPDIAATRKIILGLSRIGVDLIELGVPFSDPIADGAIIQEASNYALSKNKINLEKIFSLARALRKSVDLPLVLMSYYNPIFHLGVKKFIRRAKKAGIDGVIIADIIPEEANELIKFGKKDDFSTIFFISPTSSIERIKLICRVSSGFIYYISLTGVTGARKNIRSDMADKILLVKKYARKPVCVGFGISTRAQVKEIGRLSDGVIIGSAVINKIKDNIGKRGLAKEVYKFVETLKG